MLDVKYRPCSDDHVGNVSLSNRLMSLSSPYIFVCASVCIVYVCLAFSLPVWTYVCVDVRMCGRTYVWTYVCVDVFMNTRSVNMDVYMHVYTYVCLYA